MDNSGIAEWGATREALTTPNFFARIASFFPGIKMQRAHSTESGDKGS
jgi:hypothetical protein